MLTIYMLQPELAQDTAHHTELNDDQARAEAPRDQDVLKILWFSCFRPCRLLLHVAHAFFMSNLSVTLVTSLCSPLRFEKHGLQ
jgi:hypothetical protein